MRVTTIKLFTEWNYVGFHRQVLGAGPLKLGHVTSLTKIPSPMRL